MKYVIGITLVAASLAFSQAHEPATHTPPAHGEAHSEGEAPMPNEIWWKWANFAVLAAGLGYLVAKNAGPFFRSRSEEIQKGIRDAAQVRAEAEARAAAIESRLGNLSGEIEDLRVRSQEEITAEGARLQAETESQIRKIQAQAEMEIASATKNATLELKAYAARLALELAEKQIRQRLDSGTQEDLANTFVRDLKQEQAAEAGRLQ
ncbi:MAG TPA: hypothetical protein VEX68_24690 [Bryobacteraceae bacterium]|nr:hypothetical protein [Bryobacteraceae bacterium]